MIGWRSQVGPELESPSVVFGIVVAKSFNDPTSIRKHLEAGIEKRPDAVWVMRDAEKKDHAANFAWQTFKAHGITPFLAPLVPYWQGKGIPILGPLLEGVRKHEYLYDYDLRADYRDIEMRATCERVVVFHDKGSGITAGWLNYVDNPLSTAGIMVVERGTARTKHRKGRGHGHL